MRSTHTSIAFAVLAAALYAANVPLAKLLLTRVTPVMMASLLYLGAGGGMLLMGLVGSRINRQRKEKSLTRKELPYVVGMVLLDIAAPIFLMVGLSVTAPANASLLNNFEIVATAVIALVFFKEAINRRLWLAIGLITLSSAILTLEGSESLQFSFGSAFILLACVCWGFENNCTRSISHRNPLEIVVIKGFGSGLGAFVVALIAGERWPALGDLLPVMLLGFVTYGLSIYFYVHAQRGLGAAKTGAYYAVSPFIGFALSQLIFPQWPQPSFWLALLFMLLGAYFASTERRPKSYTPHADTQK